MEYPTLFTRHLNQSAWNNDPLVHKSKLLLPGARIVKIHNKATEVDA